MSTPIALPTPHVSYLILHPAGEAPRPDGGWLVLRCWYDSDRQDLMFYGPRPDAGTYLAAHWERSEEAPELAPIPHASAAEKLIVGKLVTDLLAAGYPLSVNDGEEVTVSKSTDAATIFAALSSTDMDLLIVHSVGRANRWVSLVWGNDCDVISDYLTSLEDLIAGANALAEELNR